MPGLAVSDLINPIKDGGLITHKVRVTFDSSYPAGGEDLTASDLGLNYGALAIMPQGKTTNGYTVAYDFGNQKLKAYTPGLGLSTQTLTVDDSDSAATLGQAIYVVRAPLGTAYTAVAEGSATGLVNDDDSAATNGVQLYIVIDEEEFFPGFALGHFEFVSPTNANGTGTAFSGGPTYLVQDNDDAASNGVAVRAIAATGGLEATLAGSGRTVLVPLSDGQFIGIADSTTGSTPNVYFDEDGSNSYERMLAVVVDNNDEDYKLYEATPALSRPSTGFGPRTASLAVVASGDSVSQFTLYSGGPEVDVWHDPAAAQLEGATPLYVQAAGAGFNAALPGAEDVYIPSADGKTFIKVAYAASPAGVQVYYNHDAATSYLKLMGVIVDNADETAPLYEIGGEVLATTDLSAESIDLFVIGR